VIDNLLLLRDLTDPEKFLFQGEYNVVRKNSTSGVLLAFSLGGLGVHHFYLGWIGLGILYVALCWTFIPALVALIETFLMPGRVQRYNTEKAEEILTKIKALRHA